MNVSDKRVTTELKVIKDRLSEISFAGIDFNVRAEIIKCETSLDVIINLIED